MDFISRNERYLRIFALNNFPEKPEHRINRKILSM